MKILPTIFLIIAFIALGGSFYLFSEMNGKLAELDKELKAEMLLKEEALAKQSEDASALNIATRRANSLNAEKLSLEANLSRVTDSIQRTRDNLAEAQREIKSLKDDVKEKETLISSLEDSIKSNQANDAKIVFTQIEELRSEIDAKDVRIQEYQDQVAELTAQIETSNSIVNFSQLKEGEKLKTELLAYDLSQGMVVVALGEENKLAPGTRLSLTNLGIPVATVEVKNVKEEFSVATILPGINRLSRMSAGAEIEFSIVFDKASNES